MNSITQTAPPQGTRIQTPDGFPVRWNTPKDADLHWLQDRMHTPDALLPMEQSIWEFVYRGFNRVAVLYAMGTRVKTRIVNGYLYIAAVPADTTEAANSANADAIMDEAMAHLRARWTEEWLPELQSHLEWCDAFDATAASTSELTAHLQEMADRLARVWELHFQIAFPSYMAMSQFDDLHTDLFGDRGAFGAYRLLQGFDNKTVELGRELWQLSRQALESEEVMAALRASDAHTAMAELARTAAGRAFKDSFRAFLARYGLRSSTWGLHEPGWIEDPTPALKSIQDYLRNGEDPEKKQAGLAVEREQAISQARQELGGYPKPIVDRYEFLLKAAQCGIVLSEDHGFYIDFGALYRVRRVLLECGKRLAEAAVIRNPEDVLFLTLAETTEALSDLPRGNRHAAVAERRAAHAWAQMVSAPPALGTDLGPPPDNPVTRFFGKFFGQPSQPSTDADVLRGAAGSPGKVRGEAKVVRSLAECDKVHAGDVLVAATTAPPWTPLFATVAAVVTDTGGILSHCAVVAREYHLPAVVGTGRTTAAIADGDLIEVDGDAGVVRIIRN